MAFVNSEGMNISFKCSELIEELKSDIDNFGGHTIVAVICKEIDGVTIYTNYDFIEEEAPLDTSEINHGKYIKKMTMSALLILLEQQNSII